VRSNRSAFTRHAIVASIANLSGLSGPEGESLNSWYWRVSRQLPIVFRLALFF